MEGRLSTPDSFKMAFQRLQNLERCLMRNPVNSADYNRVNEKHIEKVMWKS